jgi:hypothetical protein
MKKKKKKGIDLDINKKNWEYKTSINFKKKLEKKEKKLKARLLGCHWRPIKYLSNRDKPIYNLKKPSKKPKSTLAQICFFHKL